MDNLIVKTVPFMGADLMAVKDEESGKIYAGVRWMCDGIGLTRGQMNNESIKIREDAVLSQGARNLVLPTKGGKQEVQCIDREFIPMWLAKISITPAMQAEHPEVTDRLVQYQLRAAKVLADAFLRGHRLDSYAIEDPIERAKAWIVEAEERKALATQIETDRPKVNFANSVAGSVNSILIRDLAKLIAQNGRDIGEKRLFRWMRENGYLISRVGRDYNSPTQYSMDLGLMEVKETAIDHASGYSETVRTPLITGKGQQYFLERMKNTAA